MNPNKLVLNRTTNKLEFCQLKGREITVGRNRRVDPRSFQFLYQPLVGLIDGKISIPDLEKELLNAEITEEETDLRTAHRKIVEGAPEYQWPLGNTIPIEYEKDKSLCLLCKLTTYITRVGITVRHKEWFYQKIEDAGDMPKNLWTGWEEDDDHTAPDGHDELVVADELKISDQEEIITAMQRLTLEGLI